MCLRNAHGQLPSRCLGQLLHDFKAALPHAQRRVVLAQHVQMVTPGRGLCMVQAGLKAFPAARKAISKALAIMEELGLQQDEEYSSMLLGLGALDREQGRYKDALVGKGKAVLVQPKEGSAHGVLLADMAWCHTELG
jgi:hypothetical protein